MNQQQRSITIIKKNTSKLFKGISFVFCFCLITACQPHSKSKIHTRATPQLLNNEAQDIVNGEKVLPDDLIALATVNMYVDLSKQESGGGLQNVCTGTLIDTQTVLSAAHCFADLSERMNLSVEELRDITYFGFGTKVIKSFEDAKTSGIELRHAVKVEVHPEHHVNSFRYAKNQPMHDVSLIKLESEAPKTARPAHLATDATLLIKDLSVNLAGFGSTDGNRLVHATQLMKTQVKIDKPNFSNTQFSYTIVNNHTACSGDSGGPAYLTQLDASGSLVIIGVTSWGDRTCSQFGVYTSVPAMMPWLQTKVSSF